MAHVASRNHAELDCDGLHAFRNGCGSISLPEAEGTIDGLQKMKVTIRMILTL